MAPISVSPSRPLEATTPADPSPTPNPNLREEEEMAQREKEIQMPETLPLCANNCGFPANPATSAICQACLQASGSAPSAAGSCCGSCDHPRSTAAVAPSPRPEGIKERRDSASASPAPEGSASSVRRCAECRKRVGLAAGFRCRCGELFCGAHRYSDRHECGFDYKAAGRAAIARDNPLVRAPKLLKF